MAYGLAPNEQERANLFAHLDAYTCSPIPQRILPATDYVHEHGAVYLGALRLTQNPRERAVGFLRKAISQITEFNEGPERYTYQNWLSLSREEMLERTRGEAIEKEGVLALAASCDPAIIVIGGLEEARKYHLPEVERIPEDYRRIIDSYEAMLLTVHSRHRRTTINPSTQEPHPNKTGNALAA